MLKLKVSTRKIINLLINRRIVNLFYSSRFKIDFSEAKSFPTKQVKQFFKVGLNLSNQRYHVKVCKIVVPKVRRQYFAPTTARSVQGLARACACAPSAPIGVRVANHCKLLIIITLFHISITEHLSRYPTLFLAEASRVVIIVTREIRWPRSIGDPFATSTPVHTVCVSDDHPYQLE